MRVVKSVRIYSSCSFMYRGDEKRCLDIWQHWAVYDNMHMFSKVLVSMIFASWGVMPNLVPISSMGLVYSPT